MLTLTYGVQKPQSGDRGSIFWPALESDLQQLNDHTHNGTDSAKIPSTSVTASLQSHSNGATLFATSLGGGMYKSTLITFPSGTTRATHRPTFNHYTSHEPTLLGIEYVTASTYYIYANSQIPLNILYVS